MANANKKKNYWPLKIFIITLIISAGVSIVTELFMSNMSIPAAVAVLLVLIGIGVAFDIVGVAFASCPETPFVSMASRKIKKALGVPKGEKAAMTLVLGYPDVRFLRSTPHKKLDARFL